MKYFTLLQFYGVILITLYIYKKILNVERVPKWKYICAIITSFLISIPLSYTPPLYEFIFLGYLFVFLRAMSDIKLSLLVVGVFISIGISLGIVIISYTLLVIVTSLLNIVPDYFMHENITLPIRKNHTLDVMGTIFIIVLSAIISFYFFRLKRLRKGFVFLENRKAIQIGIIFSIAIILSRSLLDTLFNLLVVVNICTIGLYYWWQNQTTNLYIQHLMERDMKERDEEIQKLIISNEFLAKTIHRDNKLIPSLYQAVQTFMMQETLPDDVKQQGRVLMRELDDMMQDRREMLYEIQESYVQMPTTGIDLIDYLLQHMYRKARQENISFIVKVDNQLTTIVDTLITKQQLEVMLADLIENARIAVSYVQNKKIGLLFKEVDGCFEITICDTGIPFKQDTLQHLGKKKITTHADTNGSGIGYLTIFEILETVNASIRIYEYKKVNVYTKSIKICFDNKHEYLVFTL